jgi:hypothetical protein
MAKRDKEDSSVLKKVLSVFYIDLSFANVPFGGITNNSVASLSLVMQFWQFYGLIEAATKSIQSLVLLLYLINLLFLHFINGCSWLSMRFRCVFKY